MVVLLLRSTSRSVINARHILPYSNRGASSSSSPNPSSSNFEHNRGNETTTILNKTYPRDHMTNVTPTIVELVGRNLHLVPQHPVNLIKQRVVHHFQQTYTTRTGTPRYTHLDDIPPVVTTEQNFSSLLIPENHISRSKKDNYYINSDTMLRAHTSAHQRDFIRMGFDRFLVTGDVYRRDEIDQSHYPAFHQMEGVLLLTREELFEKCSSDSKESLKLFEEEGSEMYTETEDKQRMHTIDAVKMTEFNLKETVVRLVRDLFGSNIEYRWNSCYFPFTHPSYELEVKFKGEWMEVLGSGIMRQEILTNGGVHNKIGWAFGLGLDRLAMFLFGIPDIRLLWSRDERFISQFASVAINPATNVTFVPYSKYPPCFKDISFWLPDNSEGFNGNDFCDVVRSVAGNLVEKVQLIDEYVHPQTSRVSHCYRVTYRSMDRTLTNEEVNSLHNAIRETSTEELGIELR